jgi:hypothetical protein
MIVYCVSFGSTWFRENHESGSSAWFNSSGIPRTRTSSFVRRKWTFRGSVRFNGDHFKWVSTPGSLVGVRCFSPGVEKIENGETRVLCAHPVNSSNRIDAYIVSVRSEQHGFINRKEEWKSQSARLISASGGDSRQQEFLLLVQKGSWIRTSQGLWQWQVSFSKTGRPRIELSPVEQESGEMEGYDNGKTDF